LVAKIDFTEGTKKQPKLNMPMNYMRGIIHRDKKKKKKNLANNHKEVRALVLGLIFIFIRVSHCGNTRRNNPFFS
jgi:hypothetical protein